MTSRSKNNLPAVLVTGGAGYIGAHTCKALARSGYRPVSFDNLSRGHREAVRWGDLCVGDLQDLPTLQKVMETYRPIAVLHFAAFAYVGESGIDPELYYRNNVGGTLTLLQAMRGMGCKQLVFSSTCATYGIPNQVPILESENQKPVNPYGRSKRMIEEILSDSALAYDLRSVSLRYFNAAGADPEGELGENHDPEPHLIPLVLQTAAGKRPSLSIFGNDYETPDGTCIRDYIHVHDLANAHVKALKYLEGGGSTQYINLGTGQGHSVLEVVKTAEKITGQKIPYVNEERRPGDPPVLVADASKARRLLGWEVQYPRLDQQIEHAWAWMQRTQPQSR